MDKLSDEQKAQRRARREERREKQRAANIFRARQMHTQRRAMETARENVPTKLPKKTPAQVPKKTPAARRQLTPETDDAPPTSRVMIGCSGWYYWHWRETFYPPDSSSSQWFAHYARTFRTVELNAPFYSWPTSATVKSWLRQAGRSRMVYTVKVCELITHVKRFAGTKELVRDFGLIADLLGSRMGCFLFQLPPSFHFTPARLKRIVSQLDPARRNVVEFRHKSWWNETVYAAFREAGIIFCSCSGPRLPDVLVNTADDIYIRFHGKKQWYRHDYSIDELTVWAQRIADSGAKRVWAYFNNDRDAYAIKNARQLIRLLRKRATPASVNAKS